MHSAVAIFEITGVQISLRQLKSNYFSFPSCKSYKINKCSPPIFQDTLCSCISNAIHDLLPPAQTLPVFHFSNVRQFNLPPHSHSSAHSSLPLRLSRNLCLPRAKDVSSFTNNSNLPPSLTSSHMIPPLLSPSFPLAHKRTELAVLHASPHSEIIPRCSLSPFHTSPFSRCFSSLPVRLPPPLSLLKSTFSVGLSASSHKTAYKQVECTPLLAGLSKRDGPCLTSHLLAKIKG